MATRRLPPSRNDRLTRRSHGSRSSSPGLFALRSSAVGLRPTGPPAAQKPDDPFRTFLTKHCQECHSGEKPKGDFSLDTLAPTSTTRRTGNAGSRC